MVEGVADIRSLHLHIRRQGLPGGQRGLHIAGFERRDHGLRRARIDIPAGRIHALDGDRAIDEELEEAGTLAGLAFSGGLRRRRLIRERGDQAIGQRTRRWGTLRRKRLERGERVIGHVLCAQHVESRGIAPPVGQRAQNMIRRGSTRRSRNPPLQRSRFLKAGNRAFQRGEIPLERFDRSRIGINRVTRHIRACPESGAVQPRARWSTLPRPVIPAHRAAPRDHQAEPAEHHPRRVSSIRASIAARRVSASEGRAHEEIIGDEGGTGEETADQAGGDESGCARAAA